MKKNPEKKAKRLGVIKRFLRKKLFTSAIILVGGSSTRFGGNIPKQFLSLDGIPVAAHSMLAFQTSNLIDEIVIVCRTGDESYYEAMARDLAITKLSSVVAGGSTRQESAINGVNATNPKSHYVLIHDGARPLITQETIRDIVLATHDTKAACAATVSKDTVKIADKKGNILRTEDRNFVHLASTPQGFYRSLYIACAYSAQKEGFEVTDDASLLEHYYYPVKLVECDGANIKITTPDDLVIAEAILISRKKSK